MKIAHNRKWRSATSLVEGLHYFFALFLEEKQQFITTRRGEKKMPQNKRESLIYTFIMCFMMVFWMSIYNVSLHMGGLSMESIKAGWLGFPIAYIFAMCCDWFFVSKIAKGFAFKYLVKPDSSVLRKVISVSCCMVVPMVIIMSLYGAVEVSIEMGNFSNLLIMWLTNIPKNFVMALPYQLIIAGPVVRFVFRAAFEKLCDEAKKYNFKMVAINPAQTVRCKKKLEGSPVHVGAAIGFPLGQTTLECKIFETKDAIEKGADEIDYVINVAELKNKNYDYIKKEMEEIVKICREAGKTSKVIFENCYLTDDEKRKVAEIAKEVKPDFIKTSTGFGTGGATVEDVKLMKSVVGDEVKVKAAGGIRDLKTALAMIEAGAERLGTSAGVAIVEEYNNQK